MAQIDNLSGKEKAAILLLSLGPDRSAEIFKHLSEEQIEELTMEIANMQNINREVKDEVIEEFYQLMGAHDYLSSGGISYAKEILQEAFDEDKAEDILDRLTASLQVRPFDDLRQVDPSQIMNLIQEEHPQTIALILSYLNPDQASMVISGLSQKNQMEVAKRIAEMDTTSPDVIKQVENVIEEKISSLVSSEYTSAGGIESIVDILKQSNRATEKNILNQLDEENPELAENIRQQLFVFEDIVVLRDAAVQQVLREIDTDDLALALKTVDDEVKEKIFSNMSQRAENMLKEDIEYMGPVQLRNVEEAQQRIVNVIMELEESGEIVIAQGEEGQIVE